MKKIFIIGLLGIAILISGCVSTSPTPTPQPTMTATPTATITETAQPTITVTPATTATLTATSTTTAQSNTASVEINNFMFVPKTITVAKGTTVTWTNNDTVTHTITSVTGAFDSGNIDPGATYSYTFDQTGSFEYGCIIHTSIPHGTVTVT